MELPDTNRSGKILIDPSLPADLVDDHVNFVPMGEHATFDIVIRLRIMGIRH